jgi:hypothetical protein
MLCARHRRWRGYFAENQHVALASLIWLPEKQIPRSEDFDPGHLTLEDAVDRAEAEEPEHPGEMPWIKTQDGTILGFAEIAPLRSGLRAARRFP